MLEREIEVRSVQEFAREVGPGATMVSMSPLLWLKLREVAGIDQQPFFEQLESKVRQRELMDPSSVVVVRTQKDGTAVLNRVMKIKIPGVDIERQIEEENTKDEE